MKNEVLLKFLCHNVVVVHQAIVELGIDPQCFGRREEPQADALPFLRFPVA